MDASEYQQYTFQLCESEQQWTMSGTLEIVVGQGGRKEHGMNEYVDDFIGTRSQEVLFIPLTLNEANTAPE